MRTLIHFLMAATVLGCASLNAQESSAGIDTIRADTNAIANQMEAKNAAVLAILQKLTACNAKKRFYQPSDSSADADGCTAPALTATPPKLTQKYSKSISIQLTNTPNTIVTPAS